MRFLVLTALFLVLFSCLSTPEQPVLITEEEVTVKPANEVILWSTWYNSPVFKEDPNGIVIRDMKGRSLGVKLSRKDWCNLAMEGTGFINDKTYNYAGTSNSYKVSCSHSPSGRVKFHVTTFPYGVGNKNNPLKPFFSIACDQSKFKFGQVFYIPEADGILLPGGEKHDGIFRCDDVGGLIKGNHIDVFIGKATKNPFSFIKSSSSKTFKAYIY